MHPATRHYAVITAGYWGFTLTDGAIRMLVVLHFHHLGYSPLQVALLFLFYEFFGIVTNLIGGWLGARIGLDRTLHLGMGLQIAALLALTVPQSWLSIPWVMAAQAVSGIAKDLNKLSAKAGIKAIAETTDARLFGRVAWLTGSKNALKGGGFFLGALLLQLAGFRGALLILSALLVLVLLLTLHLLPRHLGRMRDKPKFGQVFSRQPAINWLSAARFLLFGARDVWFVVALPVFLAERLGWDFWQVGAFLALWVIGYGTVQAVTPRLLHGHRQPGGRTAVHWATGLATIPAAMALALQQGLDARLVLIGGLALFGAVFAINSAVHSYLVLAYAERDQVALRVGFYYMANAGGRLLGTVLSGLIYQQQGMAACLWWSAALLTGAALLSLPLPPVRASRHPAGDASAG